MKENIKILVVDDNTIDRHLFSLILKEIGYSQIEQAVDGHNALEVAESYKPHLILMDTQMPMLSGYEVCRQIKQQEDGQNIAIIGMSNGPYEEKWLQAGADYFVWKEKISNSFLDSIIQQVLKAYKLQ